VTKKIFYMRADHHITADKRGIEDFSKLPSATSFIRKTLSAIRNQEMKI